MSRKSRDEDEQTPPHGTESCPACGGYRHPMGSLGRRVWYRCRDCGIDSHGGDN